MRHRLLVLPPTVLAVAMASAAVAPASAEDHASFHPGHHGFPPGRQVARVEADVFDPLYVAPQENVPEALDTPPAVDPMPVETEELPPLVIPPQEPEDTAETDQAEPEGLEPEGAEPGEPEDVVDVESDPSDPDEIPSDNIEPASPHPEAVPPEDAEPEPGPPDAAEPDEVLPDAEELAAPAAEDTGAEEAPPEPHETPEADDVAPASVSSPIPGGPATIAPLGDWVGPGRHCVAGFVVTLPEGVEGLSFALGMEFRTTEGQDLGELVTGAADGAPGFDSFIEGIISHEGCLPTSTLTIDGPAAVPNSPFHALRAEVTCSLPDGTFGMDITRFTFNDGGRVALLLLLFGSNGWEVAGSRIPPGEVLDYAAAAPLFDILVEQMDYCPLEALDEQ